MGTTPQLAGQVALVTGASSGIGLAVARALSAEGASVVLAARSEERLRDAAATMAGPARVVPTDVTDGDAVRRLVATTVEGFGQIDVVVANAGIYFGGDVWDADDDAIDDLLTTNVNGVIRTVRAALEHMRPRGTGDIVITSSVSGHQAIHWEPIYSASKHALQSFTHGLRRQLVGSGLRVGAIAPGIVLNDLWSVVDEQEIADRVAAGTGLRSEDVARAVLFMLTQPRHVTIRDLVLLPRDQEI